MLKNILMSLAIVTACVLPYAPECVAAETSYPPQISNERGIKVTVSLQHIPTDAKTWDFEVTLETHTQSLSDDMAKSSLLIADGKQYQPLRWQGQPPGGHHRKGFLYFRASVPQPPSMELRIRLAGDTSPRTFKWTLK